MKIGKKFILVLLEDLLKSGRRTILIENMPMISHKVSERFFELGIDDYFLKLSDDAIEENVFLRQGVIWVK